MRVNRPINLRSRLTFWYVGVLAVLLLIYAIIVFAFQYAVLARQMFHDEVQDVVTVEGLLYFDGQDQLLLNQDYYSRPQSHLLVDRLMEVREQSSGAILYRSPTLQNREFGGFLRPGEGDRNFSERLVRLDDGTHAFMVSHVHRLDGRQLVIRLGYDLKPLTHRLLQFFLMLLLGVPVALGIAALLGQIIAKRALQPIEDMAARAQGITALNLHDRLEISNSEDELGRMAKVFNQLLERLEQAFAQLRRFTADAAHELRTPLASLRAVGEIALQEPRSAEEYRGTLSDILEETAKLSNTIDSLLLLSRAEAIPNGEPIVPFALKPLVDEVLTLLEVLTEERSIRIEEENIVSGRNLVLADRNLVRVVVMNILHNALKFSPSGSTVRIAYELSGTPPAFLRITVEDHGPGIAPGEELLVFERFFISTSSDTPQTGTGLGLAIAKLIVDRSGGAISFDPSSRTGARCVLDLPLAT